MINLKLQKNNSGYSLVELMLSIAIFTIMISGSVLLLTYILDSSNNATNQSQAAILGYDGLEIMKSILVGNYDGIFAEVELGLGDVNGAIESTGNPPVYNFSVTPTPEIITFTYDDGSSMSFERSIRIIELTPTATNLTSRFHIESKVSWNNGAKEVLFYSVVRKWR